METNEFYTVQELAQKLRVHTTTIRRAIKSGKIAAFRVGEGSRSSYRIAATEIDRMALFDLRKMMRAILEEENGSTST